MFTPSIQAFANAFHALPAEGVMQVPSSTPMGGVGSQILSSSCVDRFVEITRRVIQGGHNESRRSDAESAIDEKQSNLDPLEKLLLCADSGNGPSLLGLFTDDRGRPCLVTSVYPDRLTIQKGMIERWDIILRKGEGSEATSEGVTTEFRHGRDEVVAVATMAKIADRGPSGSFSWETRYVIGFIGSGVTGLKAFLGLPHGKTLTDTALALYWRLGLSGEPEIQKIADEGSGSEDTVCAFQWESKGRSGKGVVSLMFGCSLTLGEDDESKLDEPPEYLMLGYHADAEDPALPADLIPFWDLASRIAERYFSEV